MAHLIWADSDKNVEDSAGIIKTFATKNKIKLHFYNDTPTCIQFFKDNPEANVKVIITSLFGSERRKKLGHPNCFQMLDILKKYWTRSYSPFLVMMTSSADEQQCKDFGFNLIVYHDREKMQKIVIDKLKNDTGAYYNRLWREPSLLPCLQLKNLAEDFFNTF